MNRNFRRAACGLLLAGATAGTAIAATPESGTVSAGSPTVSWEGSTVGSYVGLTAAANNEDFPCEAPVCDAFALTVEDPGALTIGVSIDIESDTSLAYTRVHMPDGSIVTNESGEGAPASGKVHKFVIKNAPKGAYTIDHFNNAAANRNYSSFAELAIPGAAPTPPQGPTEPQPPAPGPQPPAQEAIELKVAVGKASARKLAKARKLRAKVTVSREVSSITASLKKGKKVVGKGSLGRTSGTKTLSVKLPRKFKRGTYALTVTAADGQNSTTKTVKVKVRK